MTYNEIRMLQEKLKFRTRVIIITGIVLLVAFIAFSIAEDIRGNNYMEKEIGMISRSDEWHQVPDGYLRDKIVKDLKEQKLITDKDRAYFIALNDEHTYGVAFFIGTMNYYSFITFDYDNKRKDAIARFITM